MQSGGSAPAPNFEEMVMGEERELGPNESAVKRDLEAIAKRDPDLAKSGLANVALTLARGLDSDSSLTSKAMAANALGDKLAELRELAPDETKDDQVDDLAAKRDKRRKRSAAATG